MRLHYYLCEREPGSDKQPALYDGQDIEQLYLLLRQQFLKRKENRPPHGRSILAIDGPAGSGKSVLAQRLALDLDAPLIPMDDFFLPFELRTPERFSEVGGNVHYERFAHEVLQPATEGQEAFAYQPFACSTGTFQAPRTIPASPLLIIEGVYALHPQFAPYWTMSLLLGIDPGLQRERILARETAESAALYFARWLPLEQPYFRLPALAERVDLLLTTTTSTTPHPAH